MEQRQEESGLKGYFQFGEVLGYFFRKRDPERHTNFNLKMMHGINKISIVVFLLGILFLLLKRLF
jgi:hypothetical protein